MADLPTPFLAKTFELVDDPATDNLIHWSEDGASFIIKNPIELASDLFPKYFNHNNLMSFTRQLNAYGFRKLPTKFCEYEHLLFKRGEIDRLAEIPRKNSSSGTKRAVSAVQAATTSSNTGEDQEVVSLISPPRDVAVLYATSDEEIVRENKRLREENAALRQELYKMKSIFRKVAGMMKTLSGNERVNASGSSGGEPFRHGN